MENPEQTIGFLLESMGKKLTNVELEAAMYKAKANELNQENEALKNKITELEENSKSDKNKK